ncbi:MAG TPA: hypothetical protein DDY71_09880 [Spirochaetia bacterium]|nr:hypothetical protein [Spirochaetia bacterium]
MNDTKKRIYSVNLMAYLVSNGVTDYELIEDEDTPGKYYMTVHSNISELKSTYKNDVNLHKFLSGFKFIRKEIMKRKRVS